MTYSLTKKRELYGKALNSLITSFSNHKMTHGVGQKFQDYEALLWQQRDKIYRMTADELKSCSKTIAEAKDFLREELDAQTNT